MVWPFETACKGKGFNVFSLKSIRHSGPDLSAEESRLKERKGFFDLSFPQHGNQVLLKLHRQHRHKIRAGLRIIVRHTIIGVTV